MRESLLFFFTKERPWAICSGFSWQKSVRERIAVVDLKKKRQEWFARDSSKSLSNTRKFAKKNHIFHSFFQFFTSFPRFKPKSKLLLSLFVQSLRAAGAIGSCCSLLKSDDEQITPIALYKRVAVSDFLRSLKTIEWLERFALFHQQIGLALFRSFAHKKQAIRSKNRWVNSQPWIMKRICKSKILEVLGKVSDWEKGQGSDFLIKYDSTFKLLFSKYEYLFVFFLAIRKSEK